MDIKYVLGLELTDPGFDFSVLSEFRTRLLEHQAEYRLFELLVVKLSEQGYLKKRGVVIDSSPFPAPMMLPLLLFQHLTGFLLAPSSPVAPQTGARLAELLQAGSALALRQA
jgi:hypothetical protein